jgi:hypothetical protein
VVGIRRPSRHRSDDHFVDEDKPASNDSSDTGDASSGTCYTGASNTSSSKVIIARRWSAPRLPIKYSIELIKKTPLKFKH